MLNIDNSQLNIKNKPIYLLKDQILINTINLSRNKTFKFKIYVLQENSPLKLHFEYLNIETNKLLNQF